MRKPIKAFILAAGLGERLRPITDSLPKPLLPVAGKPLLQTVLERVSALPVSAIGLNLHYKREMIEEWVRESAFRERIVLFPEDPLLDTGGALKNAESFLKESEFLVHNADILSSMDLEELLDFHRASGNCVTLAVHDCPRFNTVAVNREGCLTGVGRARALQETEAWTAFTGIAMYSQEFLPFLPAGRSSVVDAWIRAVQAGCRVGTLDVTGAYWNDIGTPSAFASSVLDFLREEGETVSIHPSAAGCDSASLDGYIVLEKGVALEPGVSLKDCIVLPGAVPPPGEYRASIIGPGLVLGLDEKSMGFTVENGAVLIGTGGSDRRYYRVRENEKTAVLMQCSTGDPDFPRHMEYTQFFRACSLPVPELLEQNPFEMRARFEDLGDTSLYSWLKCRRGADRVEGMYRKVLEILVLLHTAATRRVGECRLLQERVFDYDHLRWETGYFLERFVQGLMKAPVRNLSALQDEFHRLAATVNAFPKTVMHRDFQSQNIMITGGDTPRLIDYQGARLGPPAYDVVSMLWDPYYRLDDALRERLVCFYMERMSSAAGEGFSVQELGETLLPCRLQRHMQALGAYGFLSMARGKKYFLKHVPGALRHLKEEVTLARDEYPELYRLVSGLQYA
ncbi:MAG: phosphotransferase [Alphaproteobacteria bacterium]|uniref:Phosphotransferase n=1 Tax=Candidatus Nitrobium versatile TaxID=2884831 RepID=A0A953J7I4_9BACT|nr:phosphotransferase [Candidatus Nitrobium versatile]